MIATARTRRSAKIHGPIHLARLTSPMGPLMAGATSEGLCLLDFEERVDVDSLNAQFGRPCVFENNEHLTQIKFELEEYFAGRLRAFEVPVVMDGSPFQQTVWSALRKIPYGEVRSYRQIAEQIGSPQASRAVGRANGTNRIMIVIPCHRVVNHDGQLGGYACGLDRKRFLLDLENALD